MMQQEITRRSALKRIFAAIAATGAGSFITFDDLLAADANPRKAINVLWLHGSSCTGCTCSLLDIEKVPVVDILTRFAHMVFHHDLSLATGDQVTETIDKLLESEEPFVLVVEGSIPVRMPHTCMVAHRTMDSWMQRILPKAQACIAAGTCAAFGGVTQMEGMDTGSMGLLQYSYYRGITTPIITLPGCPMKPEHFVYSVLHYSTHGAPPPLDRYGRPRRFFGRTVHDRCVKYADFQENYFSRKIGEDGCLLRLGCQGMVTRSDCMITGYNNNTNVCLRAGHPCIGCSGENFPRRVMFHTYDDTRDIIPRRV
ncbi:hydrogenase small subunit [Desulfurispira natronophila]|uniref:Hydrogenase small subunit n=1 Tax=Desulfurispira natronophila TaxID=682562 RepID=A0A7W7Y4R6_9BACT|nr:hydrogenase small subunit [Desulfurispira natronophila]MBB5021997.1 hydrogenase small subunit [Desulfurispira natronophila]